MVKPGNDFKVRDSGIIKMMHQLFYVYEAGQYQRFIYGYIKKITSVYCQ
jgi:hypothetical protein